MTAGKDLAAPPADAGTEVSESQIAVHWREEDYYNPPETFIAQANAADPAIVDRFGEEHFPECPLATGAHRVVTGAAGAHAMLQAALRAEALPPDPP